MRRVLLIAIMTAAVALPALLAHGDPLPFTIDAAAGKGDITVAASPGARIPLMLIRTASTKDPVDLLLSPFVSAQGTGVAADIQLMVDGKKTEGRPFRVTSVERFVPLTLTVSTMPGAGNYVGSLLVTPDKKEALTFRITLTPGAPPPSALEVSPQSLELSTPRALLTTPATATFTLTETTRRRAERITARAEDAEGIDVTPHLKFWVNNSAMDLMKTPSPLSLGPGETARVKVAVGGLPAGKQTVTLRFRAENPAGAESGKLALNVQVSRPMWVAVVVLLFGLVLSFFATKFLVMYRQRLDFTRRIRDADTPWLAAMDSVLPVVWMRDVLSQVRTLGGRLWLVGHPVIDARLKQITALASVLERAHQVERDIERQDLPLFVRRRALAALGAVVSRLETGALSESRATQLIAELDALKSWTGPSGLSNTYREHLTGPMAVLCCDVRPDEIEDKDAKAVVRGLLNDLRAKVDVLAKPPADAQTDAATARKDAAAAVATLATAQAALDAAQAKAADAARVAEIIGDAIALAEAAAAELALEGARAEQEAAEAAAQKAAAAAEAARVPARLDELLAVEESYARLKILWERRNRDEISDLIGLQKNNKPLEELFARANLAVWEYLLAHKPSIEVKRPAGVDAAPTEWEPLTFFVKPDDDLIATTYLFRHGLRYRWTFAQTCEEGASAPTFIGASTEPHVVAYAEKGVTTITANVEIEYEKAPATARSSKVSAKPVSVEPVEPSPDMKVLNGLGTVEMVSWGVAVLIAMISGLTLLYSKNPTFGGFTDYLGLIAWGVGVDQTKNLVQVIQSWVPSSASKA